ncbi:MAG: helix-hairpin-helix domain-containing protein [Balneolaceae bacterium]
MNKNRFKRKLFFFIDSLQVSKRERVSISVLLAAALILILLNVFIKKKVVPPPDNYAEILAEFERRSSLIEKEKLEQEKKYNPPALPPITSTIAVSEPEQSEQQELEKEIPEQKESVTVQLLISINSATAGDFEKLPGIGKAYAQRIIEYRQTNGDFASVDDLVKVRGIGKMTLEKIKPFITL